MNPTTLKIGIWQDAGISGDIEANLKIVKNAAKKASDQGIHLLIFPECFLTGYFRKSEIRELAKQVDAVAIDRLSNISKESNVALLMGVYEISGDKFFNSAICISPLQGECARYRKRALYGEWEKSSFSRGSNVAVFEILGFKIGILICFDIEFPELSRELASNGVDLIAVPTSLMSPYTEVAKHIVAARAIENQVYVAYANRIGSEFELDYVGLSSICSPTGELLAQASMQETEMISATISLDVIKQTRADFVYLDELENI
jgi:predicted amidohydrolase